MEELNETGVETTYQRLSSLIILFLIMIQIQIKIEPRLLSMGLSTFTKLQLIHFHAQGQTTDNRFPRNEIRIHSSIKCKQMVSVIVKMVDHITSYPCRISFNKTARGMDGKIGCVGYKNGKSCSQPCFPCCFEYRIFLWTRHPERLSYQSVISRNSTAVTHCRVMTLLFHKETTALECQV